MARAPSVAVGHVPPEPASHRWLGGAAVLLVSAVFALSFGLRHGVHNQHTYLLHGLHRADPTLFTRDWLVTRTTDYHPAFAWMVVLLSSAGPHHLPWAAALANVVLLTGASVLLWCLVREVAGADAWPAFLLLLGSAVLHDNKDLIASAAGSTLLTNYLAPSTMGALGLLAGVLFFVQDRFLASGMAVALGGVFHANFLVLAFPLFGLAHLLDHRRGLFRRLLAQLGPCAVVVLARLPALLAMARDPDADAARRIFLSIRSPHHYVPLTFLPEFAPLFAWQAIGLLALVWLERSQPGLRRRLAALAAALMLLIVAATLLTTVVYVPAVAQLYVWRLAPLAVLVGQLAFVIAVVRRVAGRLPLSGRSRALAALAVLGFSLAALAYQAGHRSRIAYAVLFALAATGPALGSAAMRLVARLPPPLPSRIRPAHFVAAVALVGFVAGTSRGLLGLTSEAAALSQPLGGDRIFAWARATPRDALFAIPPGLQEFRLYAERSVVVDWKSTPILPAELREWYGRLAIVCGLEAIRSPADAERGYARMGPRRMERLQRDFGVDFVVFRQPFPRPRLRDFRVAFADRHFIVFATGSRSVEPLPAPSAHGDPRD